MQTLVSFAKPSKSEIAKSPCTPLLPMGDIYTAVKRRKQSDYTAKCQ